MRSDGRDVSSGTKKKKAGKIFKSRHFVPLEWIRFDAGSGERFIMNTLARRVAGNRVRIYRIQWKHLWGKKTYTSLLLCKRLSLKRGSSHSDFFSACKLARAPQTSRSR